MKIDLPPLEPVSSAPSRSGALSDHVASRLRDMVIAGNLAGGELIAEAATAARLGVSRVPVREALFTLQREGLVVFSESGRARVRVFTEADFVELLELRLIIEPAAARRAARLFTESDEERMRGNLEALAQAQTVEELGRLDLELHTLIVEFARLPRLRIFWDHLLPQIQVLLAQGHRAGGASFREMRPVSIENQRQLMDGILSRDPRRAAVVMQTHVSQWPEWYVSEISPRSKAGKRAKSHAGKVP